MLNGIFQNCTCRIRHQGKLVLLDTRLPANRTARDAVTCIVVTLCFWDQGAPQHNLVLPGKGTVGRGGFKASSRWRVERRVVGTDTKLGTQLHAMSCDMIPSQNMKRIKLRRTDKRQGSLHFLKSRLVAQVVKKFLAVRGIRRFISAFTKARPLVPLLSQINPFHAHWSYLFQDTFYWFPRHLRQFLPSVLFRSGFSTKPLCTSLPPPPHTCHVLGQSRPPRFARPNIWPDIPIVKATHHTLLSILGLLHFRPKWSALDSFSDQSFFSVLRETTHVYYLTIFLNAFLIPWVVNASPIFHSMFTCERLVRLESYAFMVTLLGYGLGRACNTHRGMWIYYMVLVGKHERTR